MSIELLPTIYSLEVYEDSFENDPSYHVNSQTAFSAISVGDYFNHRVADTWYDRPDTAKEKFQIQEVEHIVFVHDGLQNHHKTMIKLKKVPYSWD
ncbi:TPA: hypothetical protein ACQYFN_004656 [Vibrio parahaemolyticus]|uniref:Uncharacterized protein n=2 Tax=Vibrio parahaemolyticus TaxID=670 RepID=A0AAW3IUS9_VIBPH|nr:hypothetical protein [Vibrio parahaemolyticus]EGR3356022.1 hypothetical protein [Vibrio parahaemolyticus]ELI1808785.1 hypothetical protein [Vibrio parahaemolyticus]KOY28434.1 hypothetical protein ACX05_18775 [Vibrio parahaemolyticus]MCS0099706.1 hypothetical protein [Vibrio parahaemolyticus]ODZ73838.1 hypothetical protein BBM46_16700 [Vibrio parahaemolyticus]